jgi:uncharacterized membrane protein YjgN (DUF898 family)
MTDASIRDGLTTGSSNLPWGQVAEAESDKQKAGADRLDFEFIYRPGLFKLVMVNALLNLVTLGIYRFWAKTNVRKHIWSSVHINDEPLEYTGTGGELFKGFMMVFLTIFLPISIASAVIDWMVDPNSIWYWATDLIVILAIYIFLGFALYKARKYQLTRTNWRGIRGNLVGSAMTYSFTYFGSMIAKVLSLGWATPMMNTILQEQIISDMRFGDAAFKFRGRAGSLYPTYAICWILAAVVMVVGATALYSLIGEYIGPFYKNFFDSSVEHSTDEYINAWIIGGALAVAFLIYAFIIPVMWAIYSAKELNTFAKFTRLDGSPFKLDTTAGGLIWLTVLNLAILIFTLGFGQPFVQRRIIRYVIDRLSFVGTVDIERIRQSQEALSKRGEGLADAFDVGGI